MKLAIKRILFLVVVVGIWQLVVAMNVFPPVVLPGPLKVLEALYDGFAEWEFTRSARSQF